VVSGTSEQRGERRPGDPRAGNEYRQTVPRHRCIFYPDRLRRLLILLGRLTDLRPCPTRFSTSRPPSSR
jgi:hypothetical protein